MLLSRLKFIHLRVGFYSKQKVELPEMLGSTIRGAFGTAFKQACCVMHHRICKKCLVSSSCSYFQVFESLSLENKYRGIQHPPHPYIILPPIKNIYLPNEILYFQFTLLGDSFPLPYLLYAFQLMGKNGLGKNRIPFELVSVEDAFTLKELLTESGLNTQNLIVRDLGEFSSQNLSSSNKLFVSFVTPLRILKNNKILKDIDLLTLKENLIRRYRTLMQLYGYFHPDDFSDLNLLEMQVLESHYKRWQRFSNRQKSKINIDAVYAKWILTPNSPKNHALIKAYKIIHLGKSSSFGLGRFRLRELI
jgi:hypothetical protein